MTCHSVSYVMARYILPVLLSSSKPEGRGEYSRNDIKKGCVHQVDEEM